MLEAYASAIGTLFEPVNLLVLLGAVVLGLVVGAVPGLTGHVAIPLLLPFIFGMSPEIALILVVALHAVIFTSGSIPAILMNIPGTGPNAAAAVDGYPMSQRGEGIRAIGAGATSSMFGGILPVFLALAMVPLVMPVVMAFGQPEMAALVLLGIAFMGALSTGSITKGILSGMLGLMLSFVGYQSMTGIHRFSYGSTFLWDGFEIIPFVLGLFGLSEILHLFVSGRAGIAYGKVVFRFSEAFEGAKDVWRHRWLWLRSTVVGYVIGVIPGLGAEVATWICYGQARQTSKHPEKFGTGVVEGVIAPEAANNAKEAGSLLTTMALGIPGSGIMVIMMAAFMMVGVAPGPSMLDEHLPLAITLLMGIALANVVGGLICLLTAPLLARITSVNLDFIFTAVFVLMLAGVISATLSPLNFIVLLAFGLLGLLMKIYGYSRPALFLGFVLGAMFENYSLLSVKIYGPFFFARPIPVVMLLLIVMVLTLPSIRRAVSRYRQRRGA